MTCNLSADELMEQLHYNPETGIFARKVIKASRFAKSQGESIGSLNDSGYVVISVNSKPQRAHRLAWLYMTGDWPIGEIDHINGIRIDNRWSNLRDVETRVNAQNKRSAMSHNKTGLLGASWNKRDRRFVSRIKSGNKYLSLGGFDTAEQAHAAYINAKRRLHEGCTI